jgi:two-component system, LytTR family, response regulator
VQTGINLIREFHPDLVLLDINMKDGTGFDLLNAFTAIDFKVIFISAFDKNTIRAFRLSDVEYLLKPVNPEELKTAVSHAAQSDPVDLRLQMQALENNVRV